MELLVDDVAAAATLYEKAFGLSPLGSPTKSTGLSYRIGGFELKLCEPSEPIRTEELERRGPGPFRLQLRSPDLAATAAMLGAAATDVSADSIEIDPGRALGARLRIVKDIK